MEPIFRAIHREDAEMQEAHYRCADTISKFVELVKIAESATYMAKLRFRDPDLSEKEGKDHFFYLWLTEVIFHPNEGLLSGVFFEVPKGFEKWHQIGERLGFEPEDVFDWMVIDSNKQMKGGFTIRVTRNRLTTDEEKKNYDEYIGIKKYLPI